MNNLWRNFVKSPMIFLLPHYCVLCNTKTKRDIDLCIDCENMLPQIESACQCCGEILPTQQKLCGTCSHTPRPFERTIAVFHYQHPINYLIGGLKFGNNLVYAKVLSALLQQKLQHYYQQHSLPEAIIPVPLHAKRLQERGFNQALEIARPIAQDFKIPIIKFASVRIKNTAAQATLPAKNRQKNVNQAFCIAQPIAYQHVAVIDDVITTGNTINELCLALRKAGIKQIDVWCCARASSNMANSD